MCEFLKRTGDPEPGQVDDTVVSAVDEFAAVGVDLLADGSTVEITQRRVTACTMQPHNNFYQ